MNRFNIVCLLSFTLIAPACTPKHEPTTDERASVPAQRVSPASTTSKTTSPGVPVCSLFTQQDADAVLGVPSRPSDGVDTKSLTSCSFSAVADIRNQFGVELHTDENIDDARNDMETARAVHSSVQLFDIQTLTGIGDDAVLAVDKARTGAPFDSPEYASRAGHTQLLQFIKSDKTVEITVTFVGNARSTDGLVALARKIAAQM